jgi:hypothetical protein
VSEPGVADTPVLADATELLKARLHEDAAFPPGELQELMAAAVCLFAAAVERGTAAPPFVDAVGEAPSATEIMITVGEFLAASEIELFELGMWQTWGGVGAASQGGGDEQR